ncbi:MAG: amino acid ABC transporter ATP-binding protein [Sphaerochaetaceae bacterium]|nr:amino acid ABC transporter ATP-binding protein [Sphaerochaetaceae bacterium]
MIEIIHLKKEFQGVVPLKDVSVKINDGDVISVIGPSGTGKSTLLRCINRLTEATSGKILIDGIDILDNNSDINSLRRKIGMVFQSFNLYEHLTAVENVMLAQTKLLGKSRQEAFDKSMELLKSVGMIDHALYYPSELSGGQKQRVAIARTLSTDPEIILFDEPTSALDPLMVSEVENIIEKLSKQGRTMMIVTHSMNFAKKISNRVFYLDEGGIYEDGTPEQIFENPKRQKTRNYIFRLSNLEIVMEYGFSGLSQAMQSISEFGEKHKLGQRAIFRLQLVFEEYCVACLMPEQRQGETIIARISYREEKDSLTLNVRHNIKGIGKGMNDLSEKILSSYAKIRNENGTDDHEICFEL